jgi:uncharacterized protein (DUF433 family)
MAIRMAVETRYEHIVKDGQGVPMIDGTTIKVVEIALDHLAYSWSPEAIHRQYPHLTMGQIHSALAFYWDHKKELDEDIERRREFAEGMRAASKPHPLAERIRAIRSGDAG